MVTDTLHFVAENFEAVATRVNQNRLDERSEWVVQPRGEPARSMRICEASAQRFYVGVWDNSRGWLKLVTCDVRSDSDPHPLALAISLVYSVPGVRAREEQAGLGQEPHAKNELPHIIDNETHMVWMSGRKR